MPLSAHLLLAVTAFCCFATVFALPMESPNLDNHCRCLTTIDTKLNSRWFHKIEILPAGPHCRNTEVLITMKDKKKVCVNPDAAWVKILIDKIMERQQKQREEVRRTFAA